ncbi:PilW family protein [Pseudomonas sp. QL9]|uniref:PilW family protein n=1 Tax=Pseudomonas sp. QL9 TaxID=3242725 RepID=UPI00352A1449
MRSHRHRESGFTLVELMVAMTISLLIMVGVLTLYLNLRRSNDDMANTNSLIENGRFAIQVLQEDLAHAGFWNGFIPAFDDLSLTSVPGDVPTALAPVCADISSWTAQDKTNAVGIALQTYSGVPSGCSAIVTNLAANSDVVVIRHADTCSPGVGTCDALAAGKVYFQPSFCDTDTASYVLGSGGFTMHQRDCATVAERRKFVNNIYYIRDYAVTPGDGIPTLMRSQLDGNSQQAAVPLIEGVEAFRIELGVDNVSRSGATLTATSYQSAVNWSDPDTKTTPTNRGDGSADTFVHCGAASCGVDNLMSVVDAKLYVLVRGRSATPGYSSDKTYVLGGATLGPFTDGYKRHLFTSGATLVNVSRRRQTP